MSQVDAQGLPPPSRQEWHSPLGLLETYRQTAVDLRHAPLDSLSGVATRDLFYSKARREATSRDAVVKGECSYFSFFF